MTDEVGPQAEIDNIVGDAKGAYWDSGHPKHQKTVEKVSSLMEVIHGTENAIAEDGSSNQFHDKIEQELEAPADCEYDFSNVVELHEGQEYDADLAVEANHWASVAELPKAEAQSIAKRYQEVILFDDDARTAMQLETMDSLQNSWKLDFDKNLSACRQVVTDMGSEFEQFLNDSGMGNDHALAQTLLRVAKKKGYV